MSEPRVAQRPISAIGLVNKSGQRPFSWIALRAVAAIQIGGAVYASITLFPSAFSVASLGFFLVEGTYFGVGLLTAKWLFAGERRGLWGALLFHCTQLVAFNTERFFYHVFGGCEALALSGPPRPSLIVNFGGAIRVGPTRAVQVPAVGLNLVALAAIVVLITWLIAPKGRSSIV